MLKVVRKHREIYFIDNVKFHLDQVEGLGTFFEIEAISEENLIPKEELAKTCKMYQEKFEIMDSDLIDMSYADMIPEI